MKLVRDNLFIYAAVILNVSLPAQVYDLDQSGGTGENRLSYFKSEQWLCALKTESISRLWLMNNKDLLLNAFKIDYRKNEKKPSVVDWAEDFQRMKFTEFNEYEFGQNTGYTMHMADYYLLDQQGRPQYIIMPSPSCIISDFEALSAVGDKRVHIKDNQPAAEVISSSRSKSYSVEWSETLKQFASNDNASFWQGYTGYPIIAVLLLLGKLDYSQNTANLLSGIPWNELNKKFKRDYDRLIDYVLKDAQDKGRNSEEIKRQVNAIAKQLQDLELQRLPGRKKLPR
jgi:hypothetical protein